MELLGSMLKTQVTKSEAKNANQLGGLILILPALS